MKSIMKTGVAILVMLLSFQAVNAQDFPATEKEVKELLCKKWSAKYLFMKDQKIEASNMGLDMKITIADDMTYSMTFMSEKMKGKWSLDMTKKIITLFNEGGEPETLIKMLKKDEMSAEPSDEEEAEGMKMILVPDTL